MARNRRSLLVPESREALDRLKREVLQEKAAESPGSNGNPSGEAVPVEPTVQGVAKRAGVPYESGRDNGELTARQAGKIGGSIGGDMVKRLVQAAERHMEQSTGNGSSRGS